MYFHSTFNYAVLILLIWRFLLQFHNEIFNIFMKYFKGQWRKRSLTNFIKRSPNQKNLMGKSSAILLKVKPPWFCFMESLHNTPSAKKFDFLRQFRINVLLWISWTENKKFVDSLQQCFAFTYQAKIQMLTAICNIVKLMPWNLVNLSHF